MTLSPSFGHTPPILPLSMMQQTSDNVGLEKESSSLTITEKVDVNGTTEKLIDGTHNPTQNVVTSNGFAAFVPSQKPLKSLKFSKVFVVDPIGSSGGLAVLYKDNIAFQVVDGYKHAISEKEGGNPVFIRHMEDFVHFINDLNMTYLGFSGPSFTWSNNRLGDANIQERLDRVIANSEWLDIFPLAYVSHIATPCSDHVALAVYLSGVVDNGPKPLRFHDMKCKGSSCKVVIKECWSNSSRGSPSFIFNSKLKLLWASLRIWNKEVFGNIFTQIKKLRGFANFSSL
ncbi:hypothetical protein IFM89_022038 [Coptis chinensis]|uniref:Uncharacterized protein n=1 Tax=Coptis chinensis TaxID=261450 RepID=A0A835I5I6_9MAGN|nr:hypothetical protein IFM89_022038 [Coptis chinensis]